MAKELTSEEILKLRKPDEHHIHIELERGCNEKIYDFEKSGDLFINVPTIYEYIIYTNKDDNFENIISDRDAFKEAIKSSNEATRDVCCDLDDEELEERLIKDIDFDKFFSKDYIITIFGEPEDVVQFLNNNKFGNHKIIISKYDRENISIDDEELLNYFISNIKNMNNIFINSEGNEEAVCIADYKKTIQYIDAIVNRVQRLNLSPIEKLMYAYDIVRDRKYKMESDGEDYSVSRDLTSVTQGDKIVCLGFAKIYDMVIKKLGFNSMVHTLIPQDEDKHGHARNMVYVNDKKYNIDGVYFFDPTFDSKRKNDNSHFNSYSNFAKTYDYFSRREAYYNDYMLDLKSVFKKIMKDEKDTIIRKEISGVNILHEKMIGERLLNTFQLMAFNIGENELSPMQRHFIESNNFDKEKLYHDVVKFVEKFYRPISIVQFMEIITNVRKQEYYENPKKFPLTTRKILNITTNSIDQDLSAEERLLDAFFGIKRPSASDIMKENELDKDINRVRVAKSLRKVLDKKLTNK